MDRRILCLVGLLLVAVPLVLPLTYTVWAGKPDGGGRKCACSDGVDNDGDGLVDWPLDPGCSSSRDTSELNPDVQCDDGVDNDGDGMVDAIDCGCAGPLDDD